MSFISYLINGISLGSVYAIIALGYTMVYGIAKMLNFAHGDVIMIGAYVVLTAMTSAGLPAYAAVLIAVVFCTLLGMLIERVAYKPLRNAASPLAVLITAIGVSYLLQNIALLIFGANTKSFTSVVPIPPVVLADGKSDDHRGDDHDDRSMYRDHDRTDSIYQEIKIRSGNAGCLGGSGRSAADGDQCQ